MNKCNWSHCDKPAKNWGGGLYCSKRCSNKNYVDKRRKKLKQLAVAYKGGKCVICGYNKCVASLDFHHISDKSFGIGSRGFTRSWEILKPELDKCILVCRNCHGEIHWGDVTITSQMLIAQGSDLEPTRYFERPKTSYNKVCKHCLGDYSTLRSNQIYCTDNCRHLADRKIDRPSQDELEDMLKTMSYCAVGRKYGVSDNAIRKWEKSYRNCHGEIHAGVTEISV